MLVRDLMTEPAYQVQETASPQTAVALMARAKVTSLPVVDGTGQLVGILSEADVLRVPIQADVRARAGAATTPGSALPEQLRPLMTPDPFTVGEDDDVAEVARVMAEHGWKSVPVVKRGRLQGVISRSDIVRALATSDDAIRRDVMAAFVRFGRPAWQLTVSGGVVTVRNTANPRERQLAEWLASEVRGVRVVVTG